MEYTSIDLAKGFRVDEKTVRNWGDDHGLPFRVVNLRGKRVYDPEAVQQWAQQRGLAFDPIAAKSQEK